MKISRFVILFLFPLLLIFSLLHTLQASNQPAQPQLRLHQDAYANRSEYATHRSANNLLSAPYAIVQFPGPISSADRQALQATGVTILEYLPEYAYLIQGTSAELNTAVSLPQLYAAYPFTFADKLSPALLRAYHQGELNMGRVRIINWAGETMNNQLNATLSDLSFSPNAELSQNQLLQLANLDAVRWIEPASTPFVLNDTARNIMNITETWQTSSLFGEGQIVAVADSGLDTGNLGTVSPDFSGRIVATHVLSDGGNWADDHGHGTHVAGSVLGAGVQSGADPDQNDYANSFAGIAPKANLVVQGFEVQEDGLIAGIPDDYYQLFQQAYDSGARLHSDSWGDVTGPVSDTEAMFGGYPFGAQRTDEFIWDNPDMALFAAAGNSGLDGELGALGFCVNGDGVVDPDSLVSPGTAKNVITVGAAESTKNEGPVAGVPWFLINPNFCFAVQPIATDIIANNANGMAAFSSRGPTDDGRIKPDIVAPGTNIVSNRTHMAGATTLWGEYNADYLYSGGTSMATPLVAGLGALTRQWLILRGESQPSAALVKATLLATTTDIAPGQYGVGETQEIPDARPNSVAGWGRANAAFMAPIPSYLVWFDDHKTGLTTTQSISYTDTLSKPLQVLTDTMPLQIMLVWTDPPASLSASSQLVNDLDLQVIGPDETVYWGNGGGSADRINNVEGVVIESPMLGSYQITVTAHNVPIDEQPFALVVAGPLGDAPDLPTLPPVAKFSGTPTTGDTPLTVYFTDLSSNSPTTWSWDFGDTYGSIAQNPSHIYTNPGTYTVSLTVSNSSGDNTITKTDYIAVNVPSPPPVAEFSGTPTTGDTPLSVDFTDFSTNNPTTWSWNFGDTNTSTAQNPSHIYTNPGTYTVSLTVSNSSGNDTITKTEYITVHELPPDYWIYLPTIMKD